MLILRTGKNASVHSVIAAALLLASLSPAYAQLREYSPKKPEIEMNLDVLGDAPSAPPPVVEQSDLAPLMKPAGAVPAPSLLPPPLPKGLPSPFFTGPAMENGKMRGTHPAHTPRTLEKPKDTSRFTTMPASVTLPIAEEKEKPLPSQAPSAPAAPATPGIVLDFTGNNGNITPAIQQQLDPVIRQLSTTPDLRLQVHAYATGESGNASSARRISLSRALSVRSYLMDKGIKPNRIDVRALGAESEQGAPDRVDLIFLK